MEPDSLGTDIGGLTNQAVVAIGAAVAAVIALIAGVRKWWKKRKGAQCSN